MNWFLMTLGTALVLILTAAVIGPFFVDWTQYRGTIEANAERVLGVDVSVDGSADVRLLPSPRIELTDVAIGEDGAARLTAERVALDVDLVPLLRGELRVLDLRLGRPVLDLVIAEDGTLELPDVRRDGQFATLFTADDVTIDSVALEAMRVEISDRRTGARHVLSDVTMTGRARSLRGPFSASGSAVVGGIRQQVRIAGGAMDADGTVALSARILPETGTVDVGFEGEANARADAPRLSGRLTVDGLGRTPWSIRSDVAMSTAILTLDEASVTFGPPAAPVELSGNAYLDFTRDEPLSIALEARQLDLDRLHHAMVSDAAQDPADPASLAVAEPTVPARSAGALSTFLAPVRRGLASVTGENLSATATLDVGTVLYGGSVIRDVSAAISARLGRIEIDRAEVLFPGDTLVEADGRLPEGGFSGRIRVRAAQPSILARWWAGGTVGSRVVGPILVDADVDVEAGTVDARRLSLRLGESTASGRARYRAGGAGEAATVDLALGVPSLDLADVVAAGALLRQAGASAAGHDVLLDLAVDRLRVGAVEGASLTVDASYREDTLTIDALAAEDFAGARVFASGTIGGLTGTPAGTIEGTVTLDDGRALAAGLRGLFPLDAQVARLAGIIPALAPGELSIAVSGRPTGDTPDLSLRVDGALAGTEIDLAATGSPFVADWRSRPVSLVLDAGNPSASALARQLGLPATETDTEAAAAGAIAISLEGVPEDEMRTEARLSAGDAVFAFDGGLRDDGTLGVTGEAALDVPDPEGLASLAGRTIPGPGPIALETGVARGADGGLRLSGLSGSFGDLEVSGDLEAAASGVTGRLSLSSVDLVALSALLLGPDAWSPPAEGRPWPSAGFGEPVLPPIPLDMAIDAGTVRAGATTLSAATFGLALRDGRLTVSDLSAGMAGGTVGATLDLARTGARADLEGTVSIEDASLEDVVWRRDGRAVATGRGSLEARVSSSGFTVGGIVAGLAGDGSIRIEDGELRQLNPAPFDDIAEALAAGETPADGQIAAAFARHLSSGDFRFERIEAGLDIAAGAVRAKDVTVVADGTLEVATAAVEVDARRVAAQATLAVPVTDDERVDVAIDFSGPLESPSREVDASALVAWLNLEQLERQVEEVERQNEELAEEAAALDPTFTVPEGAPGEAAADAPPADGARRGEAVEDDAREAPETTEVDGDATRASQDADPASTPEDERGATVPVPPRAPETDPDSEDTGSAADATDAADPGVPGAFQLGATTAGEPLDPGEAVRRREASDDPIGALLRRSLGDVDEAIDRLERTRAEQEERRRDLLRRLGLSEEDLSQDTPAGDDVAPTEPFQVRRDDVAPAGE